MRTNPFQEICDIGEIVHKQGFVAANDGNISVRLDNESFIISPTGVSKGRLKPEDMSVVKKDGFEGQKKPSSEYRMHQAIYQVRDDVRAVIHVHSPFATAFAMLGKGMEEFYFPEVVITLGKIPLVPYITPSTQEFADSVAHYFQTADAVLLEKHGVVAVGENLEAAYYKIERVEHVFRIISIAQQIGTLKPLSKENIAELLKAYPVPDRIKKLIG